MKTLRYMAMFMLAATMIFASCGKDEPEPTPTPTPTPTPGSSELVLNGTGWEASITNTANMMGVSMNIDMLNTMDFLSDSTGEMFTDFTMEVPDAAPSPSPTTVADSTHRRYPTPTTPSAWRYPTRRMRASTSETSSVSTK